MFAALRSRRRSRVAIAGSAVGLVLLLSGCSTPGAVKDYNADTETNFLEACFQANSGNLSDDRAHEVCGCWYGAITGNDGMSFDRFKEEEGNIRLALDEGRLNNDDDLKRIAPELERVVSESNCLPSGPQAG